VRYQAVVAYDGTDYCGFQRQANVPTVQETLECALGHVTREEVRVLAAGRTDAGVHAEGQVIAFDTRWVHGPDVLKRAVNATLPRDVVIRTMSAAASGFHPRFDARSRRYRYTIYSSQVRSPFARRYSLHVVNEIDVAAMRKAADQLVGEQDYASFGRAPQGKNTVRRVLSVDWSVQLPWIVFDIEANAFLYRMVRSVVGTLLEVGRGRFSAGEFGRILRSCDRSLAGATVAPQGLSLVRVNY